MVKAGEFLKEVGIAGIIAFVVAIPIVVVLALVDLIDVALGQAVVFLLAMVGVLLVIACIGEGMTRWER